MRIRVVGPCRQPDDHPTSAGNTNDDGMVDIDDLNNVRNNFGAMGPDDGTLPGDAYPFDGMVNIDDLNGVRNNFGAAAGVPEPSALALALLLGFVVLVVRPGRHIQLLRTSGSQPYCLCQKVVRRETRRKTTVF